MILVFRNLSFKISCCRRCVVLRIQSFALVIFFFAFGCYPYPGYYPMPRRVLVYPPQTYPSRTSRLWQDITGQYHSVAIYGLPPWSVTPTIRVHNPTASPTAPTFFEISDCGDKYRAACNNKVPCELAPASPVWETCADAYEIAAAKSDPPLRQRFAETARRWRLEQARRQSAGPEKDRVLAKVGYIELHYRLR